MDPVYLVVWSLLILVAGSIAALAASARPRLCGWISVAAAAAASMSITLSAAAAFISPLREHTLLALPQLGASLALRVDRLSGIFLLMVALVALAGTLYSVRYMERYTHEGVGSFYPLLLLAMASMIGVLASADLLAFLVFWESMTLTSYFLVTHEGESAEAQRAGLKYFIITHGATLSMSAAALLLWRVSGSFHFDSARQTLAALLQRQPVEAHIVILLLFLGFATKAGVLPMGSWLPDAHPVAPSGMSAVLSGVLVKLGIYGLVRLFCWFLPATPPLTYWGIVVALAGTVSLFVGTLTALGQSDIKRLMAFSTIGQIGYIVLGLGTGAYCLASDPLLASISLAGALLHAVNHACFKSCLFLGAGTALYRTGTRNLDELRGLAQLMPYTTASTTIASLSIAGVPPFSGFTSKWLIVAGCILTGLRFPLFLALGLIALFISVATLATYMKVLGGSFLGQADESRAANEAPVSMIVPQAALAGLCIALGLFPQVALGFIGRAVASLTGVSTAAVQTSVPWRGISLVAGSPVAFWWPLAILAGLALTALAAYGIQRAAAPKRRDVPVWYCGEKHAPAAASYRASSFYQPFNRVFQNLYPSFRVRAPRFPTPLRRLLDFDRWLYLPAAHGIEKLAGSVSRSHVGTPQVYLLWIVMGAIVVAGLMLALAR